MPFLVRPDPVLAVLAHRGIADAAGLALDPQLREDVQLVMPFEREKACDVAHRDVADARPVRGDEPVDFRQRVTPRQFGHAFAADHRVRPSSPSWRDRISWKCGSSRNSVSIAFATTCTMNRSCDAIFV